MTTLIVATDGSELAIHAAHAGLALAKPADRVLVVSVTDSADPSLADDATGHASATMTTEEVEAQQREASAQAHAAVGTTAEALRRSASTPLPLETLVIEGDPGPALCRLAAEVDAAALIVGSRGRGGLRRALMGSVSDYVVRHAACPVVVSRES
jgi:nucleotide-binding universal stress UspA family protein